jgi:hypothetical protein
VELRVEPRATPGRPDEFWGWCRKQVRPFDALANCTRETEMETNMRNALLHMEMPSFWPQSTDAYAAAA